MMIDEERYNQYITHIESKVKQQICTKFNVENYDSEKYKDIRGGKDAVFKLPIEYFSLFVLFSICG